jgi:type I restriction enzyme S subunit
VRVETFFEKFDQFADALNAVAKMRELVLQLAVRGELVPQNPQDEPAAKAIEKIVALNGSGRAAKLSAEEESIELPFAVPASWEWVRFGDLVRIRTGKLDANAAVEGGAYPFFTCSKTPSKIATYSFDTSAVILAGNGDFNLKSYSGKFDAYQRTYVIEPLGWELGFCFWLVSAQIKRITDNQRGSAIPYLRLGDIADPLVPFPPLAEQKRIVAKVDELMALCDRLEAQQQERETRHAALARASLARFADAPTPANLDCIFHKSYDITPADLRKSILTLAVQGKLVPQDPNDEPAEVLLETIAKQRANLLGSDSLRKTKPCRHFRSDEAPNEIPATWAWTMLGEVTDIGTGSTPSRTEASFWMDGTIPWITSGSTSRPSITEGDELVTPAAVKAHRLRLYPPGTLLVALYGQGKTRGQVASLEIPATINQACAAICPLDGTPTMQGYLKLLLEKQYDEMRSFSAGGAQPNLNVQKIKEVFVPLPPLAEQRRIVAKVDQLMALVDALETQLADSRSTAVDLLEAVVAELTTQAGLMPMRNISFNTAPQEDGREQRRGSVREAVVQVSLVKKIKLMALTMLAISFLFACSEGHDGGEGGVGSQGEQGEQGIQGDQGPAGPVGPAGPTGIPGAVGAAGPQGAAGATGSTGLQGAQGPQGLRGATGPRGDDGASAGPSYLMFTSGFSVGQGGPTLDQYTNIQPIPVSGTLQNLFVFADFVGSTSPGLPVTISVFVNSDPNGVDNGAATPINCVIYATANDNYVPLRCSNTVQTAAVTAGSVLSFRVSATFPEDGGVGVSMRIALTLITSD